MEFPLLCPEGCSKWQQQCNLIKKIEFYLNRFKPRFRPLQTGSMVQLDSLLNDEANKRSLATNGHRGAEKSQKEKLYVCCPFLHNCKCWWNISRMLADCWPNWCGRFHQKTQNRKRPIWLFWEFWWEKYPLRVFGGGESEFGIFFSF